MYGGISCLIELTIPLYLQADEMNKFQHVQNAIHTGSYQSVETDM